MSSAEGQLVLMDGQKVLNLNFIANEYTKDHKLYLN